MLKNGVYKHYKNRKEYKVLCVANEEANPERKVVIYEALYDDHQIWSRPLESFAEILEIEGKQIPRFEFLREQ